MSNRAQEGRVRHECALLRNVHARVVLRRLGLDQKTKVVYFLRCENGANGPIKIGWSIDLPSRMKSLQAANPFALKLIGAIPGDASVEERIHERFAHLRLRGEWFHAAPELLEFIDTVLPPFPEDDGSQ